MPIPFQIAQEDEDINFDENVNSDGIVKPRNFYTMTPSGSNDFNQLEQAEYLPTEIDARGRTNSVSKLVDQKGVEIKR